MATSDRSSALTDLARRGFSNLGEAESNLTEIAAAVGIDRETLLRESGRSADPDAALEGIVRVIRRDAEPVRVVLHHDAARLAVWALLGASTGFAEFYLRHPEELLHLTNAGTALPSSGELTAGMLASVGAVDGFAASADEASWCSLRVAYRRFVAQIAAYDLLSADPVEAVRAVSARLADAAGAALEARWPSRAPASRPAWPARGSFRAPR